MATAKRGMTEAQSDLFETLDDVSEHLAWEFEPDNYEGLSTIGFAHIANIDGRSSFVKRIKSLANSDNPIVRENRNGYHIELGDSRRGSPVSQTATRDGKVGKLSLMMMEAHDSGYRLSISNVSDFRSGPEHQRLDVRQRLHELVRDRLQYNGYCEDAYVKTRMD